MLSIFTKAQGTNELERLIAESLQANPIAAAKAAIKGKEAFNKVIRKAMGRTGSMMLRKLKGGMSKDNPYDLAPLARHPLSDALYVVQAKKKQMGSNKSTRRILASALKPRGPGAGFRRPMLYSMVFTDNKKELRIGAETVSGDDSGKSPKVKQMSGTWLERFKVWQEGRTWPSFNTGAARARMAGRGVPMSSRPVVQPGRPIIEIVQRREDPLALFQKNLIERLTK